MSAYVWALVLAIELVALSAKHHWFDRRLNTNAFRLGQQRRIAGPTLVAAPASPTQFYARLASWLRAGQLWARRPNPAVLLAERQTYLLWLNDAISLLLLFATVITIAAAPVVYEPVVLAGRTLRPSLIYAAIQTPVFQLVVLGCFVVLLALELLPFFLRSMRRQAVRGMLVELIKLALAITALTVIFTLPPALTGVRRFLLGNMFFCGGLTFYRELRRRVRTGDEFRYSMLDSLNVGLQLMVLLSLLAVLITIPVMLVLWQTTPVRFRMIEASLEFLAFLWTLLSAGYFTLYLTRRALGARGFSWIDPPNWRVAIAHWRYHFALGGFLLTAGAWVGLAVLCALALGAGALRAWLLSAGLAALVVLAAVVVRYRPAHGLAWLGSPAAWGVVLRRAWRQGFTPPLADVQRVAYLRALFPHAASDEQLIAAVTEQAKISPPLSRRTEQALRFAVIGDPGEGDDSQLYPNNQRRGAAAQMASKSIELSQAAAPAERAPKSSDQLLRQLIELPALGEETAAFDFAIISSDVVYPGGETFDYERAFYRPNAPRFTHRRQAPLYAIPGNHDWYDGLHGFLLNFTYNSASATPPALAALIGAMAWDWRPWRRWDRERVQYLRNRYQLEQVGGLAETGCTQSLSFFELRFGELPLVVFGLDNGISGSTDYIQYTWLERRLRALRSGDAAQQPYIVVLVGNPLYVDGAFAGARETPGDAPLPRESYSPRELYELLREYHVDVVMGGDTHAYQRYEVLYSDAQGARRVMHHIVNGGGGAYLSPPMDSGWLDFNRRRHPLPRLGKRSVYHPGRWGVSEQLDRRADQVTLLDVFPTANELADKFIWSRAGLEPAAGRWAQLAAWLQRRLIRAALAGGYTNALNHDEPPLLQSFVSVDLIPQPDGWLLQLAPLMERDGDVHEQLDRALHIRRGPSGPGAGAENGHVGVGSEPLSESKRSA